MCLDTERDGPQWVREHDARCTKHGTALRKRRMDELPRLINRKESYDDILRETRQVRQTLSEGGKVTDRLAFAGARC